MEERYPIELIDDGVRYTYRTPYGWFTVPRAAPHYVTVGRLGEPNLSVVFLVRYRSILLRPGNGSLNVISTGILRFHYTAYEGVLARGTVQVTYDFGPRKNKITVVFTPDQKTDPKKAQIVWLAFTTYRTLEIPGSVSGESDFADLGTPPKDVGDTGHVVRIREYRGGSRRATLNFSDAGKDWAKTEAGVFSFGGRIGNAILVSFVPGNLTIDPQLITSVSGTGSKYSVQRKTFFDGEPRLHLSSPPVLSRELLS